ncbi:MAG: RNA-guided endonuclease InsQ/TnpB family protein, partial [Prochloraceae cyanobacterium]
MQRTIRIRLHPDHQIAKILEETISDYTWSFNNVCKYGWENKVKSGGKLHDATYYPHRAATKLPSQLVCSARVKASEALKSAFKLSKKKVKGKKTKVSCPTSKKCPIRYDSRSYTIKFNSNQLSFTTVNGRIKFNFELHEYYQQYLNWKNTSADLLKDRKGRWWFHVVMETETPTIKASNEVVGIDLGIVNPATDNRGNFYGSKHWKNIEDKIFQLRRRLQKKGTKSAKRHLKKLSGRQRRFRKDCDHVLAKRIVESVKSGATIVFEDITNIRGTAKVRKQQKRRLHGWSFAQLQTFAEYKASAKSVKIEFLDP